MVSYNPVCKHKIKVTGFRALADLNSACFFLPFPWFPTLLHSHELFSTAFRQEAEEKPQQKILRCRGVNQDVQWVCQYGTPSHPVGIISKNMVFQWYFPKWYQYTFSHCPLVN